MQSPAFPYFLNRICSPRITKYFSNAGKTIVLHVMRKHVITACPLHKQSIKPFVCIRCRDSKQLSDHKC